MARGGRRQPTPGKSYTNRTDLNATQPIQAVGNGQYGSAKASEDAQRAIPLQNAAGLQAQTAATPAVLPGQHGAFDRPTERPNEPVTAGIASGAGPGPEALSSSFEASNAEDMAALAKHLPTLEILANQPGASAGMRNFVRRIRGASPS